MTSKEESIWQLVLQRHWRDLEFEGNQQENLNIRLYQALVLSILLYNSDTWIMRRVKEHRLQVFEMAVLKKFSGGNLRDRYRNEEIS